MTSTDVGLGLVFVGGDEGRGGSIFKETEDGSGSFFSTLSQQSDGTFTPVFISFKKLVSVWVAIDTRGFEVVVVDRLQGVSEFGDGVLCSTGSEFVIVPLLLLWLKTEVVTVVLVTADTAVTSVLQGLHDPEFNDDSPDSNSVGELSG